MLNGVADSLLSSGQVPVAAAIVAIALGLLECFLGYRIFKIQVAIIAFLAGLGGGIGLMDSLVGILWLSIVVGVVIGALLAFVSMKIYKVGVFLLVAFFGFVIVTAVTFSPLVGLIVGVVLGIIGVFLTKPIIILSTAFGGGSLVAGGIGSLIWKTPELMPTWLSLVIMIALGIFACIVQFRTTRNMKE